ncbi:MAG TPA: hypothetical protein DC054_11090 [Blastocatellia bacterium]|nr:hypothetical protein [Blastocatellia bacterium]
MDALHLLSTDLLVYTLTPSHDFTRQAFLAARRPKGKSRQEIFGLSKTAYFPLLFRVKSSFFTAGSRCLAGAKQGKPAKKTVQPCEFETANFNARLFCVFVRKLKVRLLRKRLSFLTPVCSRVRSQTGGLYLKFTDIQTTVKDFTKFLLA